MAVVLTELLIGDDPAAWSAAGFTVADDRTNLGSVSIRLAGAGERRGILGWTLAGLDGVTDIDGLPTTSLPGDTAQDQAAPSSDPTPHSNGVVALDHVVVASPDLERTTSSLEALGIEARRARDTGTAESPRRQIFFWLGEPILELVGPAQPTGDGPSRIYGLACTVDDIDATAAELGDRVGRVKDAVQPGRRITTLRHKDLDMSVPIAFMSPHVAVSSPDA